MAPAGFKVIVAGGGPVGLTAAISLSKANIDFIVLERNASAVIDAGSNLVLSPMSLRALYQCGLEEDLKRVTSPLGDLTRTDHSGHDIGKLDIFNHIKHNHGESLRVVSRHDLTHVLYSNLPVDAQSKILTNKKVSRVETNDTGVIVECDDGTSYDGTFVIGADGAHSTVRQLMREIAVASGSDKINAKQPFLTTYRGLWVRFPRLHLEPGVTNETHGVGASTQLFCGEQSTVVSVYLPLEKPTRDRIRHTAEDKEAIISQWGHLPLTPDGKVTLKDAYEMRLEAGLVSLEEGVVEYWSLDGKVVLVGDAAHKFTPSTGMGCNMGMVDVVVLANEVRKAMRSSSHVYPTPAELEVAFESFKNIRYDVVVSGCKQSGTATAASTWASSISQLVDCHIAPFSFVQKYFMDRSAQQVAQTPVFDYIPSQEVMHGAVPWNKSMPDSKA